jgi:hypothetical protein
MNALQPQSSQPAATNNMTAPNAAFQVPRAAQCGLPRHLVPSPKLVSPSCRHLSSRPRPFGRLCRGSGMFGYSHACTELISRDDRRRQLASNASGPHLG